MNYLINVTNGTQTTTKRKKMNDNNTKLVKMNDNNTKLVITILIISNDRDQLN